MLESIVIGNEHEKPKNNFFSTSDLEHLGKMGKTVVESFLPEDFWNLSYFAKLKVNKHIILWSIHLIFG